jgi:aldose 1-epimerase
MKTRFLFVTALFFVLCACAAARTKVEKKSFGKLPDGRAVDIYTLSDAQTEVRITNYGGYVVSIKTPDKSGNVADVVLGFDDVNGYAQNNKGPGTAYLGAIIGRYANRIAKGKFTLNGKSYSLPQNDHGNTLHGGPNGFHAQLWTAKPIDYGVELTYVSKDGEEGFPGTMTATVRYTLEKNDLHIEYSATADKDTVVNLTNHSYFNLAGGGPVLKHQVTLHASKYTPVDSGLIPTGELRPVAGTPFDFTKPMEIGSRINSDDEQIKLGKGYDHNWVLDSSSGKLAEAAEVYEPTSGRVLKVLTTEPGIQFYTGNFLDGSIKGKGGKAYQHRTGFCLETQHFPDSPNHPDFPTATLKVGQKYHTVTVYSFSTR